jgi:hypothetical protein
MNLGEPGGPSAFARRASANSSKHILCIGPSLFCKMQSCQTKAKPKAKIKAQAA